MLLRPRRVALVLVLMLVVVLVGSSARWALRAQERADRPRQPAQRRVIASRPGAELGPEADSGRSGAATVPSVQDALLRPYPLPFDQETALEAVVAHLRKTLNAPVALDLAALERQGLNPGSTVRLRLEGVRLQTGLKLLLDQVGLTYRVVPEDNLLVLTDAQGADDPSQRILAELKSLHRDVHDLQDAIEEIYQFLAPEEPSPAMQKPRIIEEIPADPNTPPGEKPTRTKPGL
ncbi:MAG: hypothetical protein IRY99_27080 [Isosphaeraceae bacterium]|nr:hypothetical protein [Isosphaeraceae bacterium]